MDPVAAGAVAEVSGHLFGPDNAALIADGNGGAAGGSVARPLGAAVLLGDCPLGGSGQLDAQVEAVARLVERPSRVGADGEYVAAVADSQVVVQL